MKARPLVCPICGAAPRRHTARIAGGSWLTAYCRTHTWLCAGARTLLALRWAWHHQVVHHERLRSAA